jgi:3-hydroxyisobutyrate dehydrogenase-like beta-hydroxyacid dehydrogenase
VACPSAAEAATGADALVLMVVNGAQAKSVLFEAGALDALNTGAVVMLMATCSSADARRSARQSHRALAANSSMRRSPAASSARAPLADHHGRRAG